MEYGYLNKYKRKLKKLRRRLRDTGGHRLAAEASALIGEKTPFLVCCAEGEPLILSAVKRLGRYDTDGIAAAVEPYSGVLTNADFMTLTWQVRCAALLTTAEQPEKSGLVYSTADIDFESVISAYDPLCVMYSKDAGYLASSGQTRARFRADTTLAAQETGIDERRLAHEYMNTARERGISVGEVIEEDKRRIFPRVRAGAYAAAVCLPALTLAIVLTLIYGLSGALLLFPLIAAAKTIADNILLRRACSGAAGAVPCAELSEAARHKTVCVLSALAASEKDICDAAARLHRAKLKNDSGNIKFCLLCDLPPADSEETANDTKIIEAAAGHRGECVIIFRRREYSMTQRKFQGRERKRGAVEDLVRFIKGENIAFRAVYGDIDELRGAEFICALDYDTTPLMDSINTLVSAAVHPCNKDYGVFAPRITTSLPSSLKTVLTRLFGTGGCSSASIYDNTAAELYSDCFGCGTFTGKGLIRVDKYYELCLEAFPKERVLSHDILEGGLLGVMHCGEVEFNDSTPPTTKGFFKRQHRWLRGDIQNAPFIFDRRFDKLTRLKLADNIRRALTPAAVLLTLFASLINGEALPPALALISLTLPYMIGLIPAALRGLGFSNTREFYAPIFSLSRLLVSQLFFEIIFLGKNALLGIDALLRTSFRMLTGRKLLEWQTASAFDRTGAVGYAGMIPPCAAGLLLFFLSVYTGNLFMAVTALFITASLPAAVICDKAAPDDSVRVREADRARLTAEARREWRFYEDHVTEEEHFLPPDNVQYSPVYRVSRRTSPTNIGMYLLSCVCAFRLRFIDKERFLCLVSRTVDTVGKLPKYRGNLYNWYSTEDLSLLGSFVSSVDSGNFLCCLVALRQELRHISADKALISRVDSLIDGADITVFYNKPRKLFSVGVNGLTGERMPNCYDMLMSEARMLSYFAIARGKADIRHWRALSRVMSRCGHYAGPVAWTGTMFEYFMPELLLSSGKGSLCGEALSYAVYCQRERAKSRRLPFGVSESGYYAFDRELNYQYKAHGVQKLALCAGMDRDYVISPYSSFLALSHSFPECMRNIARLSRPEFTHERYGLYEALDLSAYRTGSSCGVVRSHMAHHIGMSLGGITNALCGGHLRRLFMSDEAMQRADELLEERVMAGEIVLDIEKIRDRPPFSDSGEAHDRFNVMRPEFNIIANRKTALFLSDTGLYYGRYGARSTAVPSPDYLRRPRGMFFGFREGSGSEAEEIPLYLSVYDKGGSIKRSVIFGENSAEYHAERGSISYGMRVSLFGENAAELREIAVENRTGFDREISFYGYIEPLLLGEADYRAHPAFTDLFIKPEYDGERKLVIVRRKSREGGDGAYMAIGFTSGGDFIYSFSRENVLDYNKPLDFHKAFALNESDGRSIPAPCVFIRKDMTIEAGGRISDRLFICCGRSRAEVIGLSEEIRAAAPAVSDSSDNSDISGEPVSPLPKSALCGQLARRVLPAILCKCAAPPTADKSRLRTDTLWRFGISGDYPIILMRRVPLGSAPLCDGAVSMINGLESCGLPADLVIFCRTADEKNRFEGRSIGRKCVFPIMKGELTAEEESFLISSADYILGDKPASLTKTAEHTPPRIMETVPCGEGKAPLPDGFCGGSYTVPEKGYPQCNVLASEEFGCVLSQNSLGFSYAMNSRENKLSPWYNDIMHDNDGELLLIKGSGRYFDIISGAKAVFSPAKADYYGTVDKLAVKTEVRVFRRGMGKRLCVTLANNGSIERQCALSYYVEPVLGADGSASGYGARLNYRRSGNALIVRSDRNMEFCGEMAVSCSLPAVMTTDRERFFAGEQSGELIPRAHACAAVTAAVKIPPRSSAQVIFTLSYSRGDASLQLPAFENMETVSGEFAHDEKSSVSSGDDLIDRLYRAWLPWQVVGCRMRARSGFYQNGGAYGFRDQLQDAAAAAWFAPVTARRQILRCCASQFPEGDVLHWWHKTNNGRKGVRTRCSDDMLWLPYAAALYAERTGDTGIFEVPVCYACGERLKDGESERYIEVSPSGESDTVFGHCSRAFTKCLDKGRHGLIRIGSGDWNDGYSRVGEKGEGESVWLSMFYVMVVKAFAPTARKIGETAFADVLEKQAAELSADIEKHAFRDGQYLRAFYDDGTPMGAAGDACCAVDILPQAFAELAALPDGEKRRSALLTAAERLLDSGNRLIKLFAPPFSESREHREAGYITAYPEGVRENGAQYTHAAIWYALAVLRSGDRRNAEKLASWLCPAARGEEFKNEPYYMTADIYTNGECRGRGGWSLYTGAAAWYYTLLRELYAKEREDGAEVSS